MQEDSPVASAKWDAAFHSGGTSDGYFRSRYGRTFRLPMPNGPSGVKSITCILCRMIVVNKISKPEGSNLARKRCGRRWNETFRQLKRFKHQGSEHRYAKHKAMHSAHHQGLSSSSNCQTAIPSNATLNSESTRLTNNKPC